MSEGYVRANHASPEILLVISGSRCSDERLRWDNFGWQLKGELKKIQATRKPLWQGSVVEVPATFITEISQLLREQSGTALPPSAEPTAAVSAHPGAPRQSRHSGWGEP